MFNIGEGYSYATVWQPTVEEKRVKCNLTTSKKLKELDENGRTKYENSNWSNAVFVGKAFHEAKSLSEKDRIKIINGIVDNKPFVARDGTKKYFNNVTIFEFEVMASKDEIADAASSIPKKSSGTQFAALEDDDDADIPF